MYTALHTFDPSTQEAEAGGSLVISFTVCYIIKLRDEYKNNPETNTTTTTHTITVGVLPPPPGSKSSTVLEAFLPTGELSVNPAYWTND